MTLSEKLFALRRQAGLSQEELAERLGISRQAVGKWENGTATPELQKLRELARLYQITLGELLGDAPAPAEPLPPPAPPSPPRRRRWPTVLLLLTLAIILLWTAQLHSQVAQLRSQLNDQIMVCIAGLTTLPGRYRISWNSRHSPTTTSATR